MKPEWHQRYLDEAFENLPDGFNSAGTIWRSPSNIALIKYWGKSPGQIPRNPSLSFSLENAFTEMKLTVKPAKGKAFDMQYLFEGERNHSFEARIKNYMITIFPYFPFLENCSLRIESYNTFPHSSGIASSASSMSALALCICTLEEKIREADRTKDFYRKASYMARLGSGSAARSVYGGFVTWGEIEGMKNSSDEFASPLKAKTGQTFLSLQDAVLIVNPLQKKVSSSQGHALMDRHPFAEERYRQSRRNLSGLIRAIENDDVDSFIRITENEALTLHGLMMSSDPGFLLLEPATLEILSRIRQFREQSGTFVTFTIDAGPNVHLIYPAEARQKVGAFIRDELRMFCYNRSWIDDNMGPGPSELDI